MTNQQKNSVNPFLFIEVDDYLTTQYLNFTNENIILDSKLIWSTHNTLENKIISENCVNKIK